MCQRIPALQIMLGCQNLTVSSTHPPLRFLTDTQHISAHTTTSCAVLMRHRILASQIMLGFQSLSVSTTHPPLHILTDITGFVVKGGITAVLGASGSGEDVLPGLC